MAQYASLCSSTGCHLPEHSGVSFLFRIFTSERSLEHGCQRDSGSQSGWRPHSLIPGLETAGLQLPAHHGGPSVECSLGIAGLERRTKRRRAEAEGENESRGAFFPLHFPPIIRVPGAGECL